MKRQKINFLNAKFKCQVTFFPYQQSFPFQFIINEHNISFRSLSTTKNDKILIENLLMQIYPIMTNKINSFVINYSVIKNVKYSTKNNKFQFNLFNPLARIGKDSILYLTHIESISTIFSKKNSNEKNILLLRFFYSKIYNEVKIMKENFECFFNSLKNTFDSISDYSFMIELDLYKNCSVFYEKCLNELLKSTKKSNKINNSQILDIKKKLLVFDSFSNELVEKAGNSIAITSLFIFDFFDLRFYKEIKYKNEFNDNIVSQNRTLRSTKSQGHLNTTGNMDTLSNYSENLVAKGSENLLSFCLRRLRYNSNGSNKTASTTCSEELNVIETPRFKSQNIKKNSDFTEIIKNEKSKHGFLPSNSISNIEINTEEFVHRKFFEKELLCNFDNLFWYEKDNYNLIKLDSFYDSLLFLKNFHSFLQVNCK